MTNESGTAMKIRILIISLTLALFVIALHCFLQDRYDLPHSNDEEKSTEETTQEIFEGYTGIPKLPKSAPHHDDRDLGRIPLLQSQKASTATPLALKEANDPINSATTKLDLDFLRKHEGSYSNEELFNNSGEKSVTILLNSNWFYRNPNVPQLGMQLIKKPETDDYELSGVKIAFPSGFGVIYEQNQKTGEERTLLKYKKEF